jgi:adenylylsulfate kinase
LTKPGWAIWVTGLPASGKSTVVKALKEGLDGMGVNAQILESDTVRCVLVPEPTHSPEEREAFYNSLVYIGVLLTKNGVNVIFDATANKRRWRRAARGLIEDFLQVYIKCPIEVCRGRDQRGVYRNEVDATTFIPGAQEAYEEPWHADVVLDCVSDSPQVSAEKIIEVMRENDFI